MKILKFLTIMRDCADDQLEKLQLNLAQLNDVINS